MATPSKSLFRDDGIGGADAGNGSGLIGFPTDRVEALDGRLRLVSPRSWDVAIVSIPVDEPSEDAGVLPRERPSGLPFTADRLCEMQAARPVTPPMAAALPLAQMTAAPWNDANLGAMAYGHFAASK